MEKQEKTFESTLMPYVEKLLKGIENGIDYASQEIPFVLEQYVIYSAIISWLAVLASFLLIIPCFKIVKGAKKLDEDMDTPLVFFSYASFLGPVILFTSYIGDAIKSTFLPKLFLFEKFIELL